MRLIEDSDGAPLPDALQFESPMWNAAYDLARCQDLRTEDSVEFADGCMLDIAKRLETVWRD